MRTAGEQGSYSRRSPSWPNESFYLVFLSKAAHPKITLNIPMNQLLFQMEFILNKKISHCCITLLTNHCLIHVGMNPLVKVYVKLIKSLSFFCDNKFLLHRHARLQFIVISKLCCEGVRVIEPEVYFVLTCRGMQRVGHVESLVHSLCMRVWQTLYVMGEIQP